jgi:hypothetical protein
VLLGGETLRLVKDAVEVEAVATRAEGQGEPVPPSACSA